MCSKHKRGQTKHIVKSFQLYPKKVINPSKHNADKLLKKNASAFCYNVTNQIKIIKQVEEERKGWGRRTRAEPRRPQCWSAWEEEATQALHRRGRPLPSSAEVLGLPCAPTRSSRRWDLPNQAYDECHPLGSFLK